MLDLIDQARQHPHGVHRPADVYNVNISKAKRPTGNRTDTSLRRLRKDRPDLHQRVIMEPVFLFLSKRTFSGSNL